MLICESDKKKLNLHKNTNVRQIIELSISKMKKKNSQKKRSKSNHA